MAGDLPGVKAALQDAALDPVIIDEEISSRTVPGKSARRTSS